jgi:L-threonylcarbamoyladenylate synthase
VTVAERAPARRCDSLLAMGSVRCLDATDPRRRGAALAEAVEALRAGRLVAFPTETVYGLGAWARHEPAVRRVFEAKGRPSHHPLIVHLAHAEQLGDWAAGPGDDARRLARAFWPGPLTLVLRARDEVPRAVTGGQPTVALRVPAHPVARALLQAFGDGIAAPSANRFGHVSPTTAAHVVDEFTPEAGAEPALALVLDGGPCDVGLESTIVDLSGAEPTLLRLGGLPVERLEAVLGRTPTGASEDSPRAPGRLARHYAPRLAACLVGRDQLANAPPYVALVTRSAAGSGHPRCWRLPDDPVGYGRALYATLREAEASGARELWIETVPQTGPWAAVADRLRRATSAAETEETP